MLSGVSPKSNSSTFPSSGLLMSHVLPTSSPVEQLNLFVREQQTEDLKKLLKRFEFDPNDLVTELINSKDQETQKILLIESSKQDYLKEVLEYLKDNDQSHQLMKTLDTFIKSYEDKKTTVPVDVLNALLLISATLKDGKLFEMIHYKSINDDSDVFKHYEEIPKKAYFKSWQFYIQNKL